MAFVPPIPRQTASPEAQDLANRIAALVQEYRRDHPDLSERAVRDAMEAAAGSTRRADRRAVAVIAALVAAFVGAATFLGQGGVAGTRAFPVVVVAALVAVLAATVARRRA
jgi:CRISPR/Cas system endoribonuclease Cas6 (RAMP superfamily)